MKIIAIIPCRLKSQRLKNKLIRKINDRPLFIYTYLQTVKCKLIDECHVATDSKLIIEECKKYGIKYFKTSHKHKTGTDRIAECSKKVKADIYVNVQGDEPLISPSSIKKVIKELINNKKYSASTAYSRIINKNEIKNRNIVKIIFNANKEAIYLSRIPIPHKNITNKNSYYFKHIGLYAFKREALDTFNKYKMSNLEISESIELLRLIENEIKIKVINVLNHKRSVDTESDFKFVKKIISKNAK